MKSFTRVVIVTLGLAALTGTAFAQDPVATRKAQMKKNGAAVGLLVKMSKGEDPYDSAKAKAAVDALVTDIHGFDALFPAGSDKGETRAAAKIWEDADGFKAAVAKAEETFKAAAPLAAKDLDGLKSAVGMIGPACAACHNTYRKPA